MDAVVTDPVRMLDDGSFAALFGTTAALVRERSGSLIDAVDRRVAAVTGADRDALILRVLQRTASHALKQAGPHRAGEWEDGWGENLDEFVASGFDTSTLVPKYYRANVPLRLNGSYVLPAQPDFTYRYTEMFRAWLFREFFDGCTDMYEFGCGTAHNLVHFAAIDPRKRLHGYDWARSSQAIVAHLAARGMRIDGAPFNFFEPDERIAIAPGGGVLTFGALEQIGDRHQAYLEFILGRRPSIVVDVIGAEELYDADDLFDYLALQYHRRRGYLSGYVPRLQQLAAEGRVELLKVHRHRFGNLYDDPYSYIAWRPC
jgi:hypothetical protein